MTTGGSTSGRCNDAAEQSVVWKAAPRQQPRHGDGQRQAGRHRYARHPQGQADGLPFLEGRFSRLESLRNGKALRDEN